MAVTLTTDADFQTLIADNDKVVVKYFADWCGACKLFNGKYKRLAKDEKYGAVTFLDINAETNPEARKLAGVKSLPFFATFRNGELIEGEDTAKEEKVVEMIENLL